MKKIIFAFCVLLVLLIAAVSVDAVAEFRNNLTLVFSNSSEAYPPSYPPPVEILPVIQIAPSPTGIVSAPVETPAPSEAPAEPERPTATNCGRDMPRSTPFETPIVTEVP